MLATTVPSCQTSSAQSENDGARHASYSSRCSRLGWGVLHVRQPITSKVKNRTMRTVAIPTFACSSWSV